MVSIIYVIHARVVANYKITICIENNDNDNRLPLLANVCFVVVNSSFWSIFFNIIVHPTHIFNAGIARKVSSLVFWMYVLGNMNILILYFL